MLICEKLSNRPNFRGYSFREDMVGEATIQCCAAIGSFDPSRRKNPFAYLTQIAWNAMLKVIGSEKKSGYIRAMATEQFLTGVGGGEQMAEIAAVMAGSPDDFAEKRYAVIENFQALMESRKSRAKPAKPVASPPPAKVKKVAGSATQRPKVKRPKLGADALDKVRELLRAGHGIADIAQMTGVSGSTVTRLRREMAVAARGVSGIQGRLSAKEKAARQDGQFSPHDY
jgi:hypothetical protein